MVTPRFMIYFSHIQDSVTSFTKTNLQGSDQDKQFILNVLSLKIGRFYCLNDIFDSKKGK